MPPLKGEVVRVSEPEGFGQTTGLTQADLSGGLQRSVGRLCRSKAIDCLVEALAGNVRQARLMKNTPPLRGAFRLPFATAHGPSVPAPSGQPPLQGGLSFPLDANWYDVFSVPLPKRLVLQVDDPRRKRHASFNDGKSKLDRDAIKNGAAAGQSRLVFPIALFPDRDALVRGQLQRPVREGLDVADQDLVVQ